MIKIFVSGYHLRKADKNLYLYLDKIINISIIKNRKIKNYLEVEFWQFQ